ncbi:MULTISPECIES: HAD family hydrolase [Reichenbachiella]|uniref:Putative hydrolase of the HAD superfamily n=1 Tax=Reichenbachiella agariperforans TaxID=156994 RepID=A0A1M6V6U1_REIAG|nr:MULTISPECIES: HAD family hydrolase [Reichenbachiella]MBU2912891.1 HAD hydrolase-like protein [Reichenbachiella agariperforans]RJE72798.1 HAD family hydrolase [Reichenbachiella sp. MSK19-1]SHK77182.1 putative hydrolase of the HAD superfamily [Reichenbachiella agariperforans]
MNIQTIAFDADDTLWHNEGLFREAETEFCRLLEDYMPQHSSVKELYRIELLNMTRYGYGIKAFMLSMIESAIEISGRTINVTDIEQILRIGKELLEKPVILLDDVEHVLSSLSEKYRLILATKGDLLDQRRKLQKSGLEKYFHHIEIMSEKKENDYQRVIQHLDINPAEFAMIGNSLKSDILPVLNLGGHAFHIPYHITWEHEKVDRKIEHKQLIQLTDIRQILQHL